MRRAKLFIATPTADGIVLAGFAAALAGLLIRLHGSGIGAEYHTLDGHDLITQRNRLTHAFLASDGTHLLFIDSDMTFAPDLAELLLAADKPLIGTIYPKRVLDFARVKQHAATAGVGPAVALAYDWNVRHLGGQVTVQNGLCRVEGLGGGFLLIRRDCLDRMAARGDVPLYGGEGGGEAMRAFFHDTREGDAIFDLDYSFCRRWIGCGGEVWAHVGAEIRHIGDHRHTLPFMAYLDALDPRRVAALRQSEAEAPRP